MKTGLVLCIILLSLSGMPARAVTIKLSPGQTSISSNLATDFNVMAETSLRTKRNVSWKWKEHIGIFFLKRQIDREIYRNEIAGQSNEKNDALAFASGILGIISLFFAGVIIGTLAVVLGIVALFKINKKPNLYKGKGLAVAGIIFGLVGIFGVIFAGAFPYFF